MNKNYVEVYKTKIGVALDSFQSEDKDGAADSLS